MWLNIEQKDSFKCGKAGNRQPAIKDPGKRDRAYKKGWEAHLGLFVLGSQTPESSWGLVGDSFGKLSFILVHILKACL